MRPLAYAHVGGDSVWKTNGSARGGKVLVKRPKALKKPIFWEVFSGTGVLGAIMREEFGWQVRQIDSNRDLCRKTGATCENVRLFNFDRWPPPDVIFASPPCIGWSNAKAKREREGERMRKSRDLVRWTLELIGKYQPTFWVIENPRHTALAKKAYMNAPGMVTTHWAFCAYGRPYQKSTALWHNPELDLILRKCTHTKAYEAKLGGSYNCLHKWKRRNNKCGSRKSFVVTSENK